MPLTGFQVADVTPWETASGGKAAVCNVTGGCSATFKYQGAAGRNDVVVQYFDQSDGASRFRLLVGAREVDKWAADRNLPHVESNGHTATRRTTRSVSLAPGDVIRLEVMPDSREPAPVDYIEVRPSEGR